MNQYSDYIKQHTEKLLRIDRKAAVAVDIQAVSTAEL
jgi:hypothetical protein